MISRMRCTDHERSVDDSWKPAKEGEDDAEEKEHASDLGLDFHPIIFDHGIA